MASFFTDIFRQALFDDPTIMAAQELRIVLWRNAPEFTIGDTRYTDIETVADLEAEFGWNEVVNDGYPFTHEITVGVRSEGSNRYVIFTAYDLTDLVPSEIRAIAVQYVGVLDGVTDPIIFVSNSALVGGQTVRDGDSLTANPDVITLGPSSNRVLFSWAVPPVGMPVAGFQPIEGPLALSKAAPAFETSHTQHVWLYPQRVNMIANPSFEGDMSHWSTNGSKARVASTLSPWAGQFTADNPIVESNIFPTFGAEQWTIQLMVKGTGQLRIGLVTWEANYEITKVDWGIENEVWDLNPNAYLHLVVMRTGYETHEAMLRLENFDGDVLTLDKVLVEKGFLPEWSYFDGDEQYGAKDDYSWYGGENRKGKTYSLWYNNRRAVVGRLFARVIDPQLGPLVTDDVVEQQGYVYQWVPAGTIVVPHMDVLYRHDIQALVLDKAAGVLPYAVDEDDLTGVLYPWPQDLMVTEDGDTMVSDLDGEPTRMEFT